MTPRRTTVAITGANGFLGSTLVDHFTKKGWRVIALVRQPEKITGQQVEARAYDLSMLLDEDLLADVDYLVHAAYIKQDRQHPDAFDRNIKAAKELVVAARHHKVRKCLFMSSMSAHEDAVSSYGRQKLAIEKVFAGKDCVSIRSGLIIGVGGIVKQMVDFMRSKHMVPLVGGGKQPLQIVAVNDLVKTIDKLLQSELSGVYTVASTQVYSYKQFYQMISRRLHIKVLFVPVPFFALIAGIRLISFFHLPLGVNEDNARGLKMLRPVDTTKDLKKIGVRIDPLEKALEKSGY